MKSSELHRLIKKNGWEHIKTEGSHYIYKGEIESTWYHIMAQKKLELVCVRKLLKN